MALVTVQRSPTPSNSPELYDGDGGGSSVSELCQCSSGTATPCSQKTCRTTPRQRSLSECYFAVKGAAVILPQNECLAMPRQSNSSGGDIQMHLHAMLHLLRPQDTLKMAVRLESLLGKHTRYLAIVSTNGRQDTQESIVLGIDYVSPQEITVGMVLPIWASTRIALDGDGGIWVESNGSHHVFKPVSVQAMWSVFQSLHKEHSIAARYPYFPGGLSHTWTQYYEARIASPEAFRSEWHYTYQDDSDLKADGLDRFKEKPPERAAAEKLIRMTLKDIMQSVDLDEVTSKDIRTKLEDKLEMNLSEYKEFIDEEMLVILGQMDKPSQIFPYLYLGSEWNASNFDELKQNNVGHILNVTKEVDNFFPGLFFYMKVSVSDEESTELLKYWDSTFRFIFKAREKNSAVLVHCKKGISRSSSTVIAYAMKAYGMSVEEALKHVKEKRNCITPNKGFMEQLRTYQGILDASRNRNSALFNQLKLTPSEPELVPWDGLGDEEELKKPGSDPLGVMYSRKIENATAVSVPGLLMASENILKSGPSSEYAYPDAVKDEPMAARWTTTVNTGVVGNLACKFEGVVTVEEAMAMDAIEMTPMIDPPAVVAWREERMPEVSQRPPLRRQLLNVEERIRDQPMTLRSVQEMLMRRGSHSPTTSDSYSLSSGDESDPTNGLGGGQISSTTSAMALKQRRNSKSSSGDSAIADLARFPSSGEMQSQLAQSCPVDSSFACVTDDPTASAAMMMSVVVGTGATAVVWSDPVVPPGQVKRVTMQYERGLRTAAGDRRSSPALMSLEKDALLIDSPQIIPVVVATPTPRRMTTGHFQSKTVTLQSSTTTTPNRGPRRMGQLGRGGAGGGDTIGSTGQSSTPPRRGLNWARGEEKTNNHHHRNNNTPTSTTATTPSFSTGKKSHTGKRFFNRLFSLKKESELASSPLKSSGHTTWYDELRKRAANASSSTPPGNQQSRSGGSGGKPKSDGYNNKSSMSFDENASPTKFSLKVSEPGKVKTRKEKFEGRYGPRTTTHLGSTGVGAASIWMASSHEGSVKRITTDLESRCQSANGGQLTPQPQRASFDATAAAIASPIERRPATARSASSNHRMVQSIVGHFEPKPVSSSPGALVKSASTGVQQHGTYPIGSAQRRRAPTSSAWLRPGSWIDLAASVDPRGPLVDGLGDHPFDHHGSDGRDDIWTSPLRRAGSYGGRVPAMDDDANPDMSSSSRSRSLTRPPGIPTDGSPFL